MITYLHVAKHTTVYGIKSEWTKKSKKKNNRKSIFAIHNKHVINKYGDLIRVSGARGSKYTVDLLSCR